MKLRIKEIASTMAIATGLMLAMTVSINSLYAGEVVCGHLKPSAKRFYPVNQTALDLAAKLNVKTCNGERFQEAVAAQKHTKKSVIITKEQKKLIYKKLAESVASVSW